MRKVNVKTFNFLFDFLKKSFPGLRCDFLKEKTFSALAHVLLHIIYYCSVKLPICIISGWEIVLISIKSMLNSISSVTQKINIEYEKKKMISRKFKAVQGGMHVPLKEPLSSRKLDNPACALQLCLADDARLGNNYRRPRLVFHRRAAS